MDYIVTIERQLAELAEAVEKRDAAVMPTTKAIYQAFIDDIDRIKEKLTGGGNSLTRLVSTCAASNIAARVRASLPAYGVPPRLAALRTRARSSGNSTRRATMASSVPGSSSRNARRLNARRLNARRLNARRLNARRRRSGRFLRASVRSSGCLTAAPKF